MTDPVPDDTPEKPLDPAMLRVQSRMRGLMLVGGLTLGLGLLAVLAAIIYRVAMLPDKGSAVAAPAEPPLVSPAPVPGSSVLAAAMQKTKAVLPIRAWLVSASISGDRILLAYEHANGTTMFTIDANSMEITGRLDLKPE